MDFWDLTALVFRRWKVTLPLLLISISATAFVALTAKPDYAMTSYVQLIPAKIAPTDDPITASSRNPWNQLGLNTLGQASIYATQDQEFLESLKAGKHTDNLTLTMTYPNPIVTVEVVGSTAEDATITTQMVVDRLEESAKALQRGSGVSNEDMITTKRLDQGLNLLPSRSKVKRAILAVAAAGLVLTAAGAVGFDAFARRRARRHEERERAQTESPQDIPATEATDGEEASASADEPVVKTEPGDPADLRHVGVPPDKSDEPPVPVVGPAPSASVERTALVVKRTAKVVKQPSVVKPTRPPAATYRSAYTQAGANGDDHDNSTPATNGDSAADPSDVRVVLQPKWVGGENGSKSS